MRKRKQLTIGIILPTIISKNGTVKQSLELAKALQSLGHEVIFFTYAYLKDAIFPEFDKQKVCYCIDLKKSIFYKIIKNPAKLEILYLYIAFLFISRFRRLFQYKRINIYNPHDWFGLWLVANIKKNNQCLIANINDVPNRINGKIIEKIKLFWDRRITSKIDQIIVLDFQNKTKVITWLNINPDKVTVVRSGLDTLKYQQFTKKMDLKRELNIPEKSFILISANLLTWNRRYEDVIRALNKLRNNTLLHFVILTKLDFNSSYAVFLKEEIRKYKLTKRVHFIDKFFTDEERMAYIKGGDILIFPNSPQTWGLTVIEAMAMGVPVIVSSGSGVSEVLKDGENAFIYPSGDINKLADTILRAISDRKKLKKIADLGREYVLSSFSWEKFGKDVERIMIENFKIKKNLL
ncbi:MAG: hypothetical protein KatS3mg089_0407 [Patescibacteria group bacterium]|nr:MAG: hypothetical protein KatS3mg089_0407 [Patescibacteria group bacterium]